jgi:hypothetical protein
MKHHICNIYETFQMHTCHKGAIYAAYETSQYLKYRQYYKHHYALYATLTCINAVWSASHALMHNDNAWSLLNSDLISIVTPGVLQCNRAPAAARPNDLVASPASLSPLSSISPCVIAIAHPCLGSHSHRLLVGLPLCCPALPPSPHLVSSSFRPQHLFCRLACTDMVV